MNNYNEATIEIRKDGEVKRLTREDLTPEQFFIAKRISTMIREVLTAVETAIPSDSRQYKALRTMLNDKMYSCRNDLFEYFEK